jgi:large subunit ribosomal protein L9
MNTEVILKKKVEGLGGEADLVKVRPGYARNYLFPKGLAIPATEAGKHQIERLKQIRAAREAEELNIANEYARRINKMTLTFQMQAGETRDKIFGSVTNADIQERLAKEGINIDRKRIHLPAPLKQLGEQEIEIALYPEVKARLKVVLALSKADLERIEAAEAAAAAEAKAKEAEQQNKKNRRSTRSKTDNKKSE